mgnify:CR=1 FL=1
MAKQTDLSWQLTSAYDSARAGAVYGGIVDYWTDGSDVTGLDKPAYERMLLLTNYNYALDEALSSKTIEPQPEIEALTAWGACPQCKTDYHHLLGERRWELTGRVVRYAASDVLEPTEPIYHTEAASKPVGGLGTDVAWGPETQEQITRECRSCGHQWPQATGRTGVRRG